MQIKEILNANVSNQNIKNEPVGIIDAKAFSDLILGNLGNLNQSPEAVISTLADAFSDVSFSRDEKSKVDFVKDKFDNDYEKQENLKDEEFIEQKTAPLSNEDEDCEKDNASDDSDEIKEVALETLIAFEPFEPQNLNKTDVDSEVLSFSKDIFKDNIDAGLNNVSDVGTSVPPSSFNDNMRESFDNDFLTPLIQASLNKAEEISEVQIPANINANFNDENELFDASLSLGQSDFANQENQNVVQGIITPVVSKQGESLENPDFFVPVPKNQNEPLNFTFKQDASLETEEMPIEALTQDVMQAQDVPQDINIQKNQKEDIKVDDFLSLNKQASQLAEDLSEVLNETQTNLKLKVNVAQDKNSQNFSADFNKNVKESAFKDVEPQNITDVELTEAANLGEINQEIKKTIGNSLEKSSTEFNKTNMSWSLSNVSEQSDADGMLQTNNMQQNNNVPVVSANQVILKTSPETQKGKFSSIQSASEIAQGKSSGSLLSKVDGQTGQAQAAETQFSNLVNNAGKKNAANKLSSAAQNLPARTVEQIKVNIARALNSGIDRINVSLNPKELGKIQVKMNLEKDGKVSASIAAASQDTLDMLMKDAKILQNALSSVGFDVDDASLKFSLLNQDGGNSSGQSSYADADKIENNIMQSEKLLSSEGDDVQIISDTKVNIKV